MKKAVKAGKLANGFELGKGKIVHAIDSDSDLCCQGALCGARPAISWAEVEYEVTCPKCLKIMRKQVIEWLQNFVEEGNK